MILIHSKPTELDGLIQDYTFALVIETLKERNTNFMSVPSSETFLFPESSPGKRSSSIVRSGSFSELSCRGAANGHLFERRNSFTEEKRDRSGSTGSISGAMKDGNRMNADDSTKTSRKVPGMKSICLL